MINTQYLDLVLSVGNGAILADEHYKITGHKIEVLGKKISSGIRNIKFIDFIEEYKCTECIFESFNGERYVKY